MRVSCVLVETVLMGGRESEAFQRPGSHLDGNQSLENVTPSYLGFPIVGD